MDNKTTITDKLMEMVKGKKTAFILTQIKRFLKLIGREEVHAIRMVENRTYDMYV
ncbi:MAG: hypothetical protein FD151_1788 [bacterium]|nr:MAG: hypothetical protein FD151_1788 [bacterium]